MKKIILTLFGLLGFWMLSLGAEIVISGVYQGKNIYVQNPFSGSGNKDFCTTEVFVNNSKSSTNILSSAFEIDLSTHKLSEPIQIKIIHKEDCKPKVLNPQVLKATSSFNFNSITATSEHLTWATKGEKANGKMCVEHFINNTWVIVKEVKGKESPIMCNYEVPVNHNSGVNKFRVKYIEHDGQVFYSQVAEFNSTLPPVDFFPKRVTDKIYFTRETDYELLDAYGNQKMKGRGKEFDVKSEPAGVYYINADNKTFKIFKK
jgi:hypothetical protein